MRITVTSSRELQLTVALTEHMKDESFLKQATAIFFTIILPQISHQILAQEVAVAVPSLYSFKPKLCVHASLGIPQMEAFIPAQHSPSFLSPPSTGHMKGRKCEDRLILSILSKNRSGNNKYGFITNLLHKISICTMHISLIR